MLNKNQDTSKAPKHPHLLQHYSQQPTYGNSQDALRLTNGLRNVVFIHDGILFSHKEELIFFCLQVNGWNWRTST
jgi:hypothetical protein